MPPYSSAQKQQIMQFVNLTQAKDAVAAKFLKAARWNVEEAIDAYFQSPSGAGGSTSALNKIFDSYRDSPTDNPDGIGIEGAMKYLADIQVELDEVTCLGIAELLKSPSMGEFTREGFLNGWRATGSDTLPKMTTQASHLRTSIPNQPDLFRRIYRYTFPLCRMQGQRNLQFEIAAEQWRLFFTPDSGGVQWSTPTTPWLDWWIEFLEERGKRPVNKDLWEQLEVFMRKSREDEAFGWWSADVKHIFISMPELNDDEYVRSN
ncbi:defective in cullin neddylation protein 1 [Aspergillus heteromorphus CBS 117.55]|uniref:Defective in cullin neddylation protein n=1 Tax=Aspergillus heteromorphus CBS 117.55 TaxID=1448321 RepID=A0A317V557_9EURO|nr:defective in cullin neddylation protein 1 [Aspergillus heteromorphus CBS 117.55]PWY69136.1 defective in cullin neddylation protein 1 [Aspergillus heteromorphus CBS 117.55]